MMIKYYFLALSLLNFLLFGYDKWTAKKGRRRISETVLLVITLMGGTAGAVLGMLFFKHKTAKKSFLLKFCLVVAVQILMIFILKDRGIDHR